MNFVSPSVKKILGYTEEEFKLKRNEIRTKNPLNKHAEENFKRVQEGELLPKFMLEVFHFDCSLKMLEISEVPIFDKNKNLLKIEGIAHDITERYNAGERLREQEEKYRRVFNSASDFIFLYSIIKNNTPGKFIEANIYTQRILGYSQEELMQITPDDLIAAEIWDGEHDRNISENYERIWEAKDGTIINVEISEQVFVVKGKKQCIAVARDITDRKRAIEEIKFMNEELVNQKENLEALLDNLTQTQEQLVQSEKMAALGQLIAGVAHEINTPLGAIKASVGNLSDSLESALTDLPELFQNQSEDNYHLEFRTLTQEMRYKTFSKD
jgi:PAS domain S-box-containing protein